MSYILLSAALVEAIHDGVLGHGELQGIASNISLDGTLARVENRLVYGMVEDVFGLAAAYAVAIAADRGFSDASKRTAYKSMIVCLFINDTRVAHDTIEAGDVIREVAQRRMDEDDLVTWLRAKAVD